MGGGDVEFRPRVDHGNADQAVTLDDVLLGEASCLEHDRRGIVEHREIARVVDDVGGVAIAPLDLNVASMHEHETGLECFQAKWVPVRVKKTRQNKTLELRF